MAPIKALLAILPSVSQHFLVQIIVLRSLVPNTQSVLRDNVELVDLTLLSNIEKVKKINEKIDSCRANQSSVVTYSMGFFADLINCLFVKNVPKVVSLRGTLHNTYRIDYGFIGTFLWRLHYYFIQYADRVIVMTETMADELKRLTKVQPTVIGNFIDEERMKTVARLRKTDLKADPIFLFLGRFVRLKQPIQMLRIFKMLKEDGYSFRLVMYGEGPLESQIKFLIQKYKLQNEVELRGYVREPWMDINVKADFLVLPSLSEGISRAAMEALYLGIPVLARDIDSNHELIVEGVSGHLFEDDHELYNILTEILNAKGWRYNKDNLLPACFRKNECELKLINLLKELSG